MTKFALLIALGMLTTSTSFCPTQRSNRSTQLAAEVSRQQVLGQLIGAAASIVVAPSLAVADVSDGNALPEGAAQFARVVRLKSDIKAVRKRVAEAASEIDKKEWENIGRFLRTAYATGDDMKAVAAGIYNPDNKKRALEDVDNLKKYAQAGDISVSKQDGPGFVAVADKMNDLVEDFLDSLSDVPDEI